MSLCQHKRTQTVDSRKGEGYRRRRYKCLDCDYRFSTVEVPLNDDLTIKGNESNLRNILLSNMNEGVTSDQVMVMEKLEEISAQIADLKLTIDPRGD